MKHKPEMYIATKWLLVGMVICIVLAALTACSDGSSKTGYAVILPVYSDIEAARDRLRPHYPDVATYPTVRSERWNHAYGVYYDNMIYLSKLWADKNAREPVWGSCLIYHEWLHSEGVGHGGKLNKLVNECRAKIS